MIQVKLISGSSIETLELSINDFLRSWSWKREGFKLRDIKFVHEPVAGYTEYDQENNEYFQTHTNEYYTAMVIYET